jgi:beta-lysine N6-acetyltransferase
MIDTMDTLLNSTIQHGKLNDRIFLLKLAPKDFPAIIGELNALAKENRYSKIVAKIPSRFRQGFIMDGYLEEAHIPGFFNTKNSPDSFCAIMTKFMDMKRSIDLEKERTNAVLQAARNVVQPGNLPQLSPPYACRMAEKKDCISMADLYKKIFPTYPFPVDDPGYLARTMDKDSLYFGIWKGDCPVSIASAEMDIKEKNVEMTDFATLPDHRSQGFALFLLDQMEKAVGQKGIKTAYTIARSISFGMNITFARAGYVYSGTLINNTNISGRIETMNVWYKSMAPDPSVLKQ